MCLPSTYKLDSFPAARSFSQRWWCLVLPRVYYLAPHPVEPGPVLARITWAEPQRCYLKGITVSTWPGQFNARVTKRPVNVTSLFGESISSWKGHLEIQEKLSWENPIFCLKWTRPEKSLAQLVGYSPTHIGTYLLPCSYFPTRSIRPKVQERIANFVLEISGNFSGSWEQGLRDGCYIYDVSKYDSRPK